MNGKSEGIGQKGLTKCKHAKNQGERVLFFCPPHHMAEFQNKLVGYHFWFGEFYDTTHFLFRLVPPVRPFPTTTTELKSLNDVGSSWITCQNTYHLHSHKKSPIPPSARPSYQLIPLFCWWQIISLIFQLLFFCICVQPAKKRPPHTYVHA